MPGNLLDERHEFGKRQCHAHSCAAGGADAHRTNHPRYLLNASERVDFLFMRLLIGCHERSCELQRSGTHAATQDGRRCLRHDLGCQAFLLQVVEDGMRCERAVTAPACVKLPCALRIDTRD